MRVIRVKTGWPLIFADDGGKSKIVFPNQEHETDSKIQLSHQENTPKIHSTGPKPAAT
jgi:hypothetical protein